jgi:hypothetical protein
MPKLLQGKKTICWKCGQEMKITGYPSDWPAKFKCYSCKTGKKEMDAIDFLLGTELPDIIVEDDIVVNDDDEASEIIHPEGNSRRDFSDLLPKLRK